MIQIGIASQILPNLYITFRCYFTLKLMMEPIKIKFINLRIALNSILNYIYLKMMKRNLLEVYINDLLIGGINFNFLLHFLMMILMIEK